MDSTISGLKEKFRKIFLEEGQDAFFAPGRVNLIGEHTDYNGGNVFPCTINLGTYAIARKRKDKKIRMYSSNFENLGIVEFNIENLKNIKEHDWCNYSKGVIWAFEKKGFKINHGFDILIFGNIPNGAGLSSSASLELVTAILLKDYFNFDIEMLDMVKLSQIAENQFIGVNCGIMDQFAIGMGKKDNAILLDTNTLKYEYVNLNLKGIKIVIANTNKRRGLADSKYNERRSECEVALSDIKKHVEIKALGDLDEEEFLKYSSFIKNDICKIRARHAVFENIRTKQAVTVLKENNIDLFGKLMNDSHKSLKEDYEVTGIELDTLALAAQRQEGVIGARMTGAGFGGCTISLVKNEYIEDFKKNVSKEYSEIIGYEPSFYVVSIGNGASKIEFE